MGMHLKMKKKPAPREVKWLAVGLSLVVGFHFEDSAFLTFSDLFGLSNLSQSVSEALHLILALALALVAWGLLDQVSGGRLIAEEEQK